MFRFALASFVSSLALTAALSVTTTAASAATYDLAKGQVAIGAIGTATVQDGQNMLDLARQNDDGYVDFMSANPGVDPWQPGARRTITIPSQFILPDAPRIGIVVNL